jgi:NodT family efflux transporter outer membrane factor (OMF) lipoprotein
MKKQLILSVSFSILATLAGGCMVGPDYHRPQANTPAQWGEPLAGGETNAPVVSAAWWKNFNDPELDSLIERAVNSNLELRIAQARVREARAQSQETFANLWPTVDSSGSYARSQESRHQPVLGSLPVPAHVPFENNVYQAGFDANWELDVFGGQRRAVQASSAQLAATEYGRDDVLVTLLGDVARNYIELRGAQRELAITEANLKAQEETLAIAKDRFAHGLTGDLDVEQATTVLKTTRAQVPALETTIDASIHRLGVLLGREPEALMAELSQPAPIPAEPPTVPAGLPSELLLRRPDVRQAEGQLAVATANIGVAKADLYPKFYLTGLAGAESISASDWFSGGSRFWSVGQTVTWRVFDAGKIHANIRVQNARQEQALANYEAIALRAFEDVEDSLVAYAKEQTRRQSLTEAVAASQKSLELAQRLYANGLTSFLNVLEAERSLYEAQDALVQSDRKASVDVVTLYKSLGGGWENTGRNPDALAQK